MKVYGPTRKGYCIAGQKMNKEYLKFYPMGLKKIVPKAKLLTPRYKDAPWITVSG